MTGRSSQVMSRFSAHSQEYVNNADIRSRKCKGEDAKSPQQMENQYVNRLLAMTEGRLLDMTEGRHPDQGRTAVHQRVTMTTNFNG